MTSRMIKFGISPITVISVVIFSVFSMTSVTSAIPESIITSSPLSDLFPLLTIDVLKLDKSSLTSDIDILANVDEYGISFVAVNNSLKPISLNVDKWEYSIIGDSWESTGSFELENSTIESQSPLLLYRLDISQYEDKFVLYPGKYTVSVTGSSWTVKDFGNYNKSGNFKDYFIQTEVSVNYNKNKIISSPAKILKTKGMQLGVVDDNDPFKITGNSPKMVSFYIVNSGNEKISGVISDSLMTVWSADNRYPDVFVSTVTEPKEGYCEVIEPGARKKVDMIVMSKDNWPFGKNGIAEQMKSKVAPNGLYMFKFDVGTSSCSLNGEQIKGSNYSILSATEVLP